METRPDDTGCGDMPSSLGLLTVTESLNQAVNDLLIDGGDELACDIRSDATSSSKSTSVKTYGPPTGPVDQPCTASELVVNIVQPCAKL